jgi:CRP-like cAMP-binding protein
MYMPGIEESLTPTRNRLLAALPPDEYERWLPHLERVQLENKQILYEVHQAINYVYFPLTGVVSLLALADDIPIEVSTVGHEGMVGIAVFLGVLETSGRAITQVPGVAMRTTAEMFTQEMAGNGFLMRIIRRYVQALIIMISQNTACNRVHAIQERCAKWLLMTHDRVITDQFPLTQEFLAQMLGVRRASVSQVAGEFRRAGLIEYRRGVMTILDREGLEAVSCSCYQVIRAAYERTLGEWLTN